jgi:hypothetical protein
VTLICFYFQFHVGAGTVPASLHRLFPEFFYEKVLMVFAITNLQGEQMGTFERASLPLLIAYTEISMKNGTSQSPALSKDL